MTAEKSEKKETAMNSESGRRRPAGRKKLPPGRRKIALSSNVPPAVKKFFDQLADHLSTKEGGEISVASLTAEALEHAMPFVAEKYGVRYDAKTGDIKLRTGKLSKVRKGNFDSGGE